MEKLYPHWVRLRQFVQIWRRIVWQEMLSPLTSPNARFSILLSLVVVFFPDKQSRWPDFIVNMGNLFLALCFALPLYILITAAMAVPKAKKELAELGQWHGSRFVYHTPLQGCMVHVSEKDNEKQTPLKLESIPHGARIRVGVRIDAHHNLVKGQVTLWHGKPNMAWEGITPIVEIEILNDSARPPVLLTKAEKNADPVTVRALVYWWDITPS